MYSLVWTEHFTRSAKKFMRKHPEVKVKFADTLRDLETDPASPHLKLHALSGRLKGIQAVRLTYSFRITLTIKIVEEEIILLHIGSHDAVYR
ncbi:MAG: plasmid stabilization protein [Deltaproteobacteria bacterium]|nr:plasmid stabilization protein [Deltaproteobacteria bacterium]